MKIEVYDTTLRDGEQAEGVSLSLDDKLSIASRLDAFGVDVIEGGFPASNPKDAAFFAAAAAQKFTHARLAAFGATVRKGCAACDDAGMAALLACGAPIVAIVGKASQVQVTEILQTTPEENLRMIADSVGYLARAGREVVFDAEHFFDGYTAASDYALACLRAAANAGARTVVLCDTNGGTLPSDVGAVTSAVLASLRAEFPQISVGFHGHNDTGCAVANAIAAVCAGATQVQGTVNGYGERVGNTDILTTVANLELKLGYECVGADNLRQMTSLSRYVAEVCNLVLPSHHPYTGISAFAHKGGLHASALSRDSRSYNHTAPESVGNTTHTVVSELAGRASLVRKAAELGIDIPEERVADILAFIKQREAEGYSYELADGSLALLILRQLGRGKAYFTLESFRVIVDDYEDRGALAKDAMSEATIKIHVGTNRFVATGEGAGPVGALDNALRLAISAYYPEIASTMLTDFKVRILAEDTGTDAVTRVVIISRDARGSWGTIGVSENILEASWNALVDSVEYGLMRAGAVAPEAEQTPAARVPQK